MKKGRLRALLISHEFSPTSGSECAVGWNIITRLADYHDITVLFASGSQASPGTYLDEVTRYYEQHPITTGMTIEPIDQPLFTKITSFVNSLFYKIGPTGLPVLYYLGYNAWHRKVFRMAKALHKAERFDVVHQVTQISFREPGYTWKLDIPFFWGPTGGIADLPMTFFKSLTFASKFIESIRYISNSYQSRCVSRIKLANRKASVIYTYSIEDENYFKKRATGHIKHMLDVGTILMPGNSNSKTSAENILTAVWCGHLSYRKAPALLLEALAAGESTRQKVFIKIIGSGPLERDMHNLADELGLCNIDWIKSVKHEEVFEIMRNSDFLIHTSLREATSSVIPEALSVGLPVICHDANGMKLAVTDDCGIKVPLLSPRDSVIGFHEAIKRLIDDRTHLLNLKNGAKNRAAELTWDKMAQDIADDYWISRNQST